MNRTPTFAEIVGDTASLVQPIKKAMKQIQVDVSRDQNVVIYGLDIDPAKPQDTDALKKQTISIMEEIEPVDRADLEYNVPEMNQITVLGKLSTAILGKAPPLLVRMKCEKEAKAVLVAAKKLSQIRELRNVYIAADLNAEMRVKRKQLREKLKISGGAYTS